jgi:hypothetical protein
LSGTFPNGIAISGGFATWALISGLTVVTFHPSSPQEGSLISPALPSVWGRNYVTMSGGSDGLVIMDVQDPDNPSLKPLLLPAIHRLTRSLTRLRLRRVAAKIYDITNQPAPV